ncbi:MAG: beta-ketoacyl synthase N-terminal-like domain-containing protein [Steroidobacteraceae bacterium]
MSDADSNSMTPIKRALLEIRELKSRLAAVDAARREPIAIIGCGLRFPGGVDDADSLWELLRTGTDAITEIPRERWSLDALYDPDLDAPGKMITRYGGFLADVDRFDAEFFGIAPREAETMDPQQRLLLEISWQALEDAGHASPQLAGSKTGVYIGISNSDYGRALMAQRDELHVYSASGGAYSVAAGRLSYFLGLQGPSMAIDTACSSSLAAVHLACQALRLGECDMALAGGVNLILSPEANIGFSKAGMMAPDGRCKTFDAAADGYVRSEGCAMIVLRRLSDALADGDRIVAVIRGSALNQDGRSGGLTAPNGPAQESVIRAALDSAGLEPRDVGYVETHGTGTPLGDPIEAGALGNVFARGRAQPLRIGSIKTNIGHLESAAGVAGLLKAALMLHRRQIPPHLHLREPSPHVDWAGLALTVPTQLSDWDESAAPLRAGVSSFGFSGTNAHVILEQAPAAAPGKVAGAERPLYLLALGARDSSARNELAGRYAALDPGHGDVASVCYTAAAGRTHFRSRLAVVGRNLAELRDGLRAHLAGRDAPAVLASGNATHSRPRIAFLFTGYGAQQRGMARGLYERSPEFRASLERCDALLASRLGRPLVELLYADGIRDDVLDDSALGHPALFAVEYALAQTWRSWGMEPLVVVGHSLGEYAAACIAGVMDLADALHLVAERGRLSRDLPGESAMLAVTATRGAVEDLLRGASETLVIAVHASPSSFVLSGTSREIAAVAERASRRGIETKAVRASKGFHSPLVGPALGELERVAEGLEYRAPEIDLISNVTGRLAKPGQIDRPGYWVEHMRSPVRFSDSMQELAGLGITHCIEIGPHPVLSALGTECLPDAPIQWLPSLRRGREDWAEMLESLQRLYVDGADVDWVGFERGGARRRVALPTYPFQRRRYWAVDFDAQPMASAPRVDVASLMSAQAQQGPLDFNAATYASRLELLARLTAAHAARTLRDSGLFTRAGERRTLTEVMQAGGFGATYAHLVGRWLQDLATRGVLRSDGDHFVSDQSLSNPGLDVLWREVDACLADDPAHLRYLHRCGDLLGAVLTGRTSPLETLFPGGSFELAADLYTRSGVMRYVNAIARCGIEALAGAVPRGKALRVLEIGAGTGGTTAALLPGLPADRVRYVFTDVSQVFLDRAREVFAEHRFLDFRLLDLERDPATQGFEPGSFDVVISANAVHATRDLRVALRHLRDLLVPGGTLLLLESTRHHAWFDMTTGLIEGWQRFDDGLRADNPLLAAPQWCAALTEAGFASAQAWPQAPSVAETFGQHVLHARTPALDAAQKYADSPAQGSTQGVGTGSGTALAIPAIRARLATALPDERQEILREFVRERVQKVLRLAPDQLPGRAERLMDLGFDSLMAVQLRGLLGKELGLDRPLPATLMFDHPTIDAIADYLLGRLGEAAATQGAPAASQGGSAEQANASVGCVDDARVAQVAAMSDDEIAALLNQRLEAP